MMTSIHKITFKSTEWLLLFYVVLIFYYFASFKEGNTCL